MHEQRSSFNGIDTCNVVTVRKFNFLPKFFSEYEARSIVNTHQFSIERTNKRKCIDFNSTLTI